MRAKHLIAALCLLAFVWLIDLTLHDPSDYRRQNYDLREEDVSIFVHTRLVEDPGLLFDRTSYAGQVAMSIITTQEPGETLRITGVTLPQGSASVRFDVTEETDDMGEGLIKRSDGESAPSYSLIYSPRFGEDINLSLDIERCQIGSCVPETLATIIPFEQKPKVFGSGVWWRMMGI
jgi:hypothetical protein